MIRSLQSLRGIFVMFIFLSHYKVDGCELMPSGGDCGVAFFIMLSGFVLSAGYADRLNSGRISYRNFLSKRIRKIYPLHIICFIWAVIVSGCFSIKTAIFNLALLQSWIPHSDYYFSYNSVGWFLSDTLWFYVAFPCLVLMLFKWPKTVLPIFFGIAILYASFLWIVPPRFAPAIIYINPLVRTIDFGIGILLWKWLQSNQLMLLRNRLETQGKIVTKTIIELLAIAVLCACISIYNHVGEPYVLSVYWWPTMAITILVFSLLDANGGLLTRLLHHKAVMWFGSISFGFFMFHLLVIRSFPYIKDLLPIDLSAGAQFLIVLSLTTLVAAVWQAISQRIYEK